MLKNKSFKLMLFIFLGVLIGLLILNFPSINNTTKQENDINEQLDSLKNIIDFKQKQIDSNKTVIFSLKDSMSHIDEKVINNNYTIYKLDQDYDQKTHIINNYTSDQLYSYLSNRYSKQ